ncbi:MAG: hypothetical protein ABL956_12840 [Hyphomonadaceae bacterium]
MQSLFKRCVVFETTGSCGHSFTTVKAPADDPMKSFAIYLYTHARPSAETAQSRVAYADTRQVTLSVLGVTTSTVVRPRGFQIDLPVNLSQRRVALEITSYAQRMLTAPSDLGEVSIVVDRVIFV